MPSLTMTVIVAEPACAGAVHETDSPTWGASAPVMAVQAGVSSSPFGRESVRFPVSETCWIGDQTFAPPSSVDTSLIDTPPRPYRCARSTRNAALNAFEIHTVR